MRLREKSEFIFIVLFVGAFLFAVTPYLVKTYAFDVAPTVDTAREAARTTQSEVYRFGVSQDKPVQYSDGTIVPSRTFSIEAFNHTTGEYEIIGYINIHGHKVKVDSTDVYDISIGSTLRFNPKH